MPLLEEIDWHNPVVKTHAVNRGLLGWWLTGGPFSGLTLRDLCGRYHGTRTNGPVWMTGGKSRLGKRGLDYESGSSQYVDLGDPAGLRLTRFTLAAWVKPESFANTNCIITKSNASGGTLRNYNFDIQNTGTLRLYYTTGASSFHGLDPSTVTLSTGVWAHVIGSYDGATLRIYVNGLPAGTAATAFTPDTTTGNCCFGRLGSDNSNYVDGVMDDLRIYNWGYGDAPAARLYRETRLGYPGALRRKRVMRYTEQAAAAASAMLLRMQAEGLFAGRGI